MSLPAILDLGAATPLWTQLCAAQGTPLTIDASDVERLGGLCFQVLVAAEAQWRADGQSFTIENISPAYAEAVRMLAGAETHPTEQTQ